MSFVRDSWRPHLQLRGEACSRDSKWIRGFESRYRPRTDFSHAEGRAEHPPPRWHGARELSRDARAGPPRRFPGGARNRRPVLPWRRWDTARRSRDPTGDFEAGSLEGGRRNSEDHRQRRCVRGAELRLRDRPRSGKRGATRRSRGGDRSAKRHRSPSHILRIEVSR